MSGLERAVAKFIGERDGFITAINNCPASNQDDYWRWQGNAEARRVLREDLEREGIAPTAASDVAAVKAGARQEAAQSIRDEAVDEAVDGWLPLATVIRICEETGR